MNFDWLKAITAKIEGRNVTIALSLAFCILGIWIAYDKYTSYPLLARILLGAFSLLGIAIVLIGLLAPPQPTDVTPRSFVRQIGTQQFIYVAGMQSRDELIEILREAHNVQPLPPPVALISGSAANEKDYHPITAEQAAEIVRHDDEEVQKNLVGEAIRILSSLRPQKLPSQAIRPPEGNRPELGGTQHSK